VIVIVLVPSLNKAVSDSKIWYPNRLQIYFKMLCVFCFILQRRNCNNLRKLFIYMCCTVTIQIPG
jgi:hypothetical protein